MAGALVALILAACTSGGTSSSPTVHAVKGAIKIGIDLPIGDQYGDELSTQRGAQLAIAPAGTVCGAVSQPDACFSLTAWPLDDALNGMADPSQGGRNVQRFSADPSVLAMISPSSTSLILREAPIATGGNLAMVSPGNTNECLTQAPLDGHCGGQAAGLRPGGKNLFFRLQATIVDQGPAGADFAYNRLGKRKAYVFNDQQPESVRLSTGFAERFRNDGGTVLDPDLGGFAPERATGSDLTARLQQAAGLGADLVYFGGTAAGKGGLLRQAMQHVLDVPFLGAAGISGSDFLNDAAPNAAGSYFTIAGIAAEQLSSAQPFLRTYRAAYGSQAGALSAQGYDAAGIIVAALKRAIDDAGGRLPTREQVSDELAKTRNYRGAIGTTGFDKNGDTTLRIVTVYQWTPASQHARYEDMVTVT